MSVGLRCCAPRGKSIAILALTWGMLLGASVATAWGAGGSTAGRGAQPSSGKAPQIAASHVSHRVIGSGKTSAVHKPAPPLQPAHGTVLATRAAGANTHNTAELGGVVRFGPPHKGVGRLIIPPPSSAHPATAKPFTPSAFYSSTQLDNFSAQCGFGVNETTIAQSTDNPNLVVAGANTYYDNSGNCQHSHTRVYYSADGGHHWQSALLPGLLFPSS